MDLVDLVDLFAVRVAEEINAVRAEMITLLFGEDPTATSSGMISFEGGSAVIPAGLPVVEGGSA